MGAVERAGAERVGALGVLPRRTPLLPCAVLVHVASILAAARAWQELVTRRHGALRVQLARTLACQVQAGAHVRGRRLEVLALPPHHRLMRLALDLLLLALRQQATRVAHRQVTNDELGETAHLELRVEHEKVAVQRVLLDARAHRAPECRARRVRRVLGRHSGTWRARWNARLGRRLLGQLVKVSLDEVDRQRRGAKGELDGRELGRRARQVEEEKRAVQRRESAVVAPPVHRRVQHLPVEARRQRLGRLGARAPADLGCELRAVCMQLALDEARLAHPHAVEDVRELAAERLLRLRRRAEHHHHVGAPEQRRSALA